MILGTSLCCISILLCNMQSVTICFLIILSCTYFQFFFRCTCFHLLFFITLLYHVFSLYGKHLFYALNMRGINYVFTNQKARVNYCVILYEKTLHIIFWYYLLIRKFITYASYVFMFLLSTSCVYPVAVSRVKLW